MKTILGVTAIICMGLLLSGCGQSSRSQARAVIVAKGDDAGASLSRSIVAYVNTVEFREAVAARSGLPQTLDPDVRVVPYRDTALLEVTASASSSSNALMLVRTSISVLTEHFDAMAKKHRGDEVRADNNIPEDQKELAIAIAEGIPRSVIQVIDPPTVPVE